MEGSVSFESKQNEDCVKVEIAFDEKKYRRLLFGSLTFNVIAVAVLICFATWMSASSNDNTFNSTEPISKWGIDNDDSSLDQDDCGVTDFMVRDSICDDAANNEACFFDGGDCCLETKVSSLCYNCLCQLALPMEDLAKKFQHHGVQKLNNPSKLSAWFPITLWIVPLVASMHVCSFLCIDTVNAWNYDKELSCHCMMIEDVFSFDQSNIQDMVPTPVDPFTTPNQQSGVYAVTNAAPMFHQTREGINNCCYERNKAFILDNFDNTKIEVVLLGGWDCFQTCHADQDCHQFMWNRANRECYIVRTSDNIYGEINEYFIVGGGHCTNKTSYHLAITSNKTLANRNVMFSRTAVTYREAEAICKYANIGRLYEPRNYTRYQVILESALKLDFYSFWIGITDTANEGRYIYNSDGKELILTDWSPNMVPDNVIAHHGDEDFVHVMRYLNHDWFGFNDNNEVGLVHYACESTSAWAVSSDGIR